MEDNVNTAHSTELNTNMTICNACGNEVSKKAPNCPKCGNPIKKSRKGLGCAIGCLTPILIIILLIAGINITGTIKEKQQMRKHKENYDTVVQYIKENGTYTNGSYCVSLDLNELYNTNNFTDDYTIFTCVDSNDEIYFCQTVQYDDTRENLIKINCNRNGAPHECSAKLGELLSVKGMLTSYSNNTYHYTDVVLDDGGVGMVGKADNSSADWFTLTLNNAIRHVDSFGLGISMYDLYGFE